MDAQLAMFNNGAEVVSLSTPQLVAYNFGPNRPDPVISGIGDPRHVGSTATTVVKLQKKLPEEERGQGLTVLSCSASLGDGGSMVGNSKHKHFTERDQRLYSTPFGFF